MDGKKRIARLRNDEKWKKLGFARLPQLVKAPAEPAGKPKKLKKKALNLVRFVDAFPAVVGKDGPRADGKVWDFWRCAWIDPPMPGLFGEAKKVIDKLQKKGFKVLGSGHYSTVLAKEGSDKVIKVTRHQDNWIDYVKWAAENGYAGGFAPRVYSWKKFPGGWSWAVMERMDRCLGYSGHYNSYGDMTDSKGENDFDLIFSLLQHAGDGNMMAQVYMEDLAPGAFDFVKHLRKTMRASDIRGANTMVRKDGTLCFTDPCAGETTLKTSRLRSGDFPRSLWRYLIASNYRYRSQWTKEPYKDLGYSL